MVKKNKKIELTHYTIEVDDYEYYYHFGKRMYKPYFDEEYEDLDESNRLTLKCHMAVDSDDKKFKKGYKVEFDIRPSYVFGKHNTEIEFWGYGEKNRNMEVLSLYMPVPKDSFSNILSMLIANKIQVITVTAKQLRYNSTRVKSFSLHTYLDPDDY